jgi:hypothetical protein
MKVVGKWFAALAATAALCHVSIAIAVDIYLTIGLPGNPIGTNPGYREAQVSNKLAEMPVKFLVGDRIFVNWNDGYSSTYGVKGTGNVNTVYETSAPVLYLYAGGGGEGGGGGCGGGSWEAAGTWRPYSASIEGTTVTGWEFVQTGWEWVPQSCN